MAVHFKGKNADRTNNLGSIEKRLDRVETRLDGLESRMSNLEKRMEKLEDKIDKLVDKVDTINDKLGSKIEESNRHAQILTGTVAGALIALVLSFLK